ncbi:SusC/RagA family TonB-linked outer membrane protein [Flavobacterium psychroterrae]|uniref:SusC/RagA family TonB-linked outer membrane protein n=1 Tax=Flavobacterium psychroterrae TaxID=2133767 RepID=A0ABS5PIP7_9FLAO|nr:SusC/RagA family TonB-linked outer membrane protein [Flavobacterium psychroterrae]MBS7234167.1 SusC/RagA family TonB-linked outer membrane protein [Flavobacterium psychroterrae]
MNYFSFYKDGKALYCLIFTGIMLSFSSTFAENPKRLIKSISQQHQVQGTVTDGSSPLPGVTIAIKGRSTNASISDYNGQYSISVGVSDTLVVSFIGFKKALIPVQGRSKIDIVLQYDTTTLQEVRVNAGYYSVKESERTGSIARITSKDIETQPVTNVLATMQGRMAGVSITQTTGTAGGGFDIKIRGQNSIRPDANAPLYIIDGVPYSSDAIGSGQTSTIFPTSTSPLNSINPETIESIEVLKDADATSIYGSRGANGVVLITTKKGKAGKTKFSLTSSTGIGKVTKFLNLMNTEQYLVMRKQAFVNDGITEYNPWDYDVNGTWDQNRNTDWQKELLGGSSQISELQGTISGGSEQTQFMINGNYHHETTVFPGDFGYKKGGSQMNLNHRSENNKFRIAFSAGYNVQNNLQPAFDLTNEARFQPPNAPALYNADGTLNWENGTWENPLRNLNAKYESKTKDLIANTLLSYEIAKDLTIKSSFGYTDLKTIETRTSPSTLYNPIYNVSSMRSSIYSNNTNRSSWIIEPQINWEKVLGDGKLGILTGATFQNQTTSTLYQSASGFSSNSLIYNLAAAKFVSILQNDETQYKYQAFFARINYNLIDKYIVNFTARRDGSSRFGPGNQFATFGAIGVAWLFSNENFLKNSSWFSFGKIRSSYGTTGNDQIGDYQYLNTYTTSGVNYNNAIGLQPSRLFNPDFAWEINKKLEFAIELGFLKDRIFATASWYQNRSSNQLVGIPLAGTTGFTLLQANLDATVQNRGTELTLRTVNFNKGNFKWSTNFNLTFATNKLLAFPGLESSPYNQKYRIGEPLNIVLLYKYKGINPQTGIYEFEDLNNDGTTSFPDDRQTTANLNPKFYGGIQNQFELKRWKLDFHFQFVKQTNRSFPMGPAGMMSNQQARIAQSWQAPGDNAPYQIFTTGYNNDALMANYFYSESTAVLTDASFIRLKNISLSYELPVNLKESSCKIMLQGQNLLTFTKYIDGDPEFTTYGYLPPLKVISLAVQLTF